MKKQKWQSEWLRKRWIPVALVLIILALLPFVISQYMVVSTASQILADDKTLNQETLTELRELEADCILVLGAGLKPDGTPNLMLRDRLEIGIELYRQGAAPKLLLSGDNGQERYDEVNAMKDYVMAAGVPEEVIFLDHAGFSTYDTMYRTEAIFQVKKAIVVTQTYHQYRSLYAGNSRGMEVWGVASDQAQYRGQSMRDLREILARDKDFVKCLLKMKPKFLGDTVPISGSGLVSHD